MHLFFGLLASLSASLFENGLHVRVENTRTLLAHWGNELFDIFDKRFFERLVIPSVGLIKFGEFSARSKEQVDVVYVFRALALRIRHDAHNGLRYLVSCSKERNRVVVTLAHFLAVCAGNDANPFQYHLFRLLERFAVRI